VSEPENVNLIELDDVLPPLFMELPLPPLGAVAEVILVSGLMVSILKLKALLNVPSVSGLAPFEATLQKYVPSANPLPGPALLT